MGSGHDAVASELGRRLRAAGHRVDQADVLDLLPPGVGAGLRGFYQVAVRHLPALYGGLYAVFFRAGAGPRPGSTPLAALAQERLLAVVARERPDVVVSTFHLAAQLTGRLRALSRLAVPSAVVVTDFAVHRQWLHRGNDLHLFLTSRLAAQVAAGGLGRPVAASGPLVAGRFRAPAPGGEDWRRRLADRAGDRPAVLLSAGAWGAGSRLLETARLLAAAGYLPVVLCGHNERLRRSLAGRSSVLALGWVDDMPGLLAAGHALVDNAAGQTALEALAAGVPVVGYRPIPGHGAEGVRCMAALGLTSYAADSWGLLRALDDLTWPTPQATAARSARVAELFSHDALPPLEDLLVRPRQAASPA
ncbi:galactosyldiacylglycerol synthase [Streptomyces sp. NPDC059740]|uniref:MGDG synthase family glycosyltransferase n=1 Tax=Streptomyces sp. NPDC059740 TaxID=3346926 RepID=UPI00365786A6